MNTSQDKSSGEKTNGWKTNTSQDVEEIEIPVPWGHICGKLWGPKDKQPIVALHGWQDNAGTFDTLAPLIQSHTAILALDLPGHGLSSHYHQGQFYYIFWDGILVLRRIVKYYKWDKVKLLGHSLGGAIGFLYAATYPEEVDLLISLDIVCPIVPDIKRVVAETGKTIDKFLDYEGLAFESVPSYEYGDALKIVQDAYNGSITKEAATILMKRGSRAALTPGHCCFSRDPRLKVAWLGMLSVDLVLAYAARIKCNYLNIRAMPGLEMNDGEIYKKVLNQIKQSSRNYEYHEVEGTHHVHLTQPELVAPIIAKFLDSCIPKVQS